MDAQQTKTPSPNEQLNKKRKTDETLNLSSDDDDTSFFRFLVVSANNHEAIKHNIFAIQKLLKCAVGDVVSAKKLANGTVLIEVASKHQEKSALKMKMWVDVPISVTPHRTLNFSRGVIRCREFRDCDDTEVLDALRSQGVTEVRHISSKRNGVVSPTNTFIVTFNKSTLPKFVKAAYMKIPVEQYIPNPLRCFNCQKYGHGKSNCKQKSTCSKCGQEGHEDTGCHNPVHCANCSGAHAAYSKECPIWNKQRAITQIKFERNVSFHEARQVVEKQDMSGASTAGPKRPGVSYAKAASTQTCTASTQTELTWPLESNMPVPITKTASRKTQSSATVQTDTTEIHSVKQSTTAKGNSSIKVTATVEKQSSSTKVNTVGKAKAAQKPGPAFSKASSNRSRKGANDPIGQFNKYGVLEDDYEDDMEYEVTRAKSASPSTRTKKSKSPNNG